MIIPTPIPMNDNPVICVLNPCTWPKIMGKAWKVRYRMPRIRDVLLFLFSDDFK